jgi:ectoine hydroxylase-related dioxygenase (phytanoyl-CoA dioxygenase family)
VENPDARVTRDARLSEQQRDALERLGYLVVPSLLDEEAVGRMSTRLEELIRRAVAAWQGDPGREFVEAGVVRDRLEPADPDFAPCHEHPLVADAARAVLGPPSHLFELALRAPLPGFGHQGLHQDFEERRTDGPWQSLSAMWCVTAFTRDNGALRVLPGSHRQRAEPIHDMPFGTGMGPHPAEVRIVAPAGSLILFNGADLWHSGTHNFSPAPRLAVTACFTPG